MRNTPFIKYSKRIVNIRESEFQKAMIFKHFEQNQEWFDLSEISKTYYGNQFSKILDIKSPKKVDKNYMQKFENLATKLGFNLNIIEKNG